MERQDLELAELIAAARNQDRVRLAWRAGEARRASGVAWSGMGPDPVARRTEDALIAEARAKLAARRWWRRSAQGQFVDAVARVQGAARALHAHGERAREAAARGLQDESETCEALVRDLRRQALLLMAGVRAAQRAVRGG